MKCPECRSRDVAAEQKKEEIDNNSASRLVMRSWLAPGAVLKNSKQYRTFTQCTCRSCGHTWEARSSAQIGMAIIGAVILICVIILEIVTHL